MVQRMKRSRMRKRKRSWLRNSLIILFLLVSIVTIFWIYQFNRGLSEASDGIYREDGTNFEPFEASEPPLGDINILLIGSDTRGEENGLSDTLMIAHYNEETNRVKIASIMRDVYVDVPSHGQQKVNAAFALGGPELVRKTIKQNFDVDIHYYAVVDFQGFPKIVDAVAPGGIEVDIPYEMSHGIGMTLEPGLQTLHGDQLLGYVRFRHDQLSDFGRVDRQQEVLSKLKEQAVSMNNLVNLPKILGLTDPYIETNVSNRTLFTIGKGLLAGKSEQVETLRIPVADSFADERVAVGQVLAIDFDKNKKALHQFLSTSDLKRKIEGIP